MYYTPNQQDTPLERILSALKANDCQPKPSGKGWQAQCPAHDDQNPSLSINEGTDGRELIKCQSRNCSAESIVSAINLDMKDLFSNSESVSTSTETHKESRRCRRRQTNGKHTKSYPDSDEAITALDSMMDKEQAKRVGKWSYHDKDGSPVCVIIRYDSPTQEGDKQDKTFRPVSLKDDRWIIGGMIEPKPLYSLSEVISADQVFITEGEKAADAIRELGLTATTSMNGAQSPGKTDWSPLAGKECVILPDNDDAGELYADTVIDLLSKLSHPPYVKVAYLPDLPDKGDAVDWIEARSGVTEKNELKEQLLELTLATEVVQADELDNQPDASIDQFKPFPTEALPEPLRSFVESGAEAIGCDASYLALPALTICAAAIGSTWRYSPKRGWNAPAILWSVIIGLSGSANHLLIGV